MTLALLGALLILAVACGEPGTGDLDAELGADPVLDSLHADCVEGDLAACDLLRMKASAPTEELPVPHAFEAVDLWATASFT